MLKISKYQGLGNDFIICLDEELPNKDYSALAINLCNNVVTGITDGLICVKTNPLTMVFYNRDGSVGTMCGNGLRCFVRYCYDNNLLKDDFNVVSTLAGEYETKIISTEPFIVKAKMNKPDYSSKTLKIKTDKEEYFNQNVKYKDQNYSINCVFMGTHHTVIFVDDVQNISEELGHYMCHLSIFDDRTNVDFVQIVSENHLLVKTYERGVGFTLACGTGACASFCVARRYNKCASKITVSFEKGSLQIEEDKEENVYMQGETELVGEWKYSLNK